MYQQEFARSGVALLLITTVAELAPRALRRFTKTFDRIS